MQEFIAGLVVGLLLGTALIAWMLRYMRALAEYMLKEKIYALNKIITILEALKQVLPDQYKPIVEETLKFCITWRNANEQLLKVPIVKLSAKLSEVLHV